MFSKTTVTAVMADFESKIGQLNDIASVQSAKASALTAQAVEAEKESELAERIADKLTALVG